MDLLKAPPKALDKLVERKLCEASLYEFMRYAWPVLEPGTPFQDSWCQQVVCQHLEALVERRIRRLCISIPPGFAKSSSVCVCLPAWRFIRNPSERFLCTTYNEKFALRDSIKTRDIIRSPWYQSHWGHLFGIRDDRDTQGIFYTSKQGFRQATSASGTGARADIIIADDVNKIEEADQKSARDSVNHWWDNVMVSRGGDPRTCCHMVIAQRLHPEDLIGHLVERGDYEWLYMPMEFEPDRRCRTSIWEDPRQNFGDLLWPERFDAAYVASLKKSLGYYGAAAQLAQRPENVDGGVFKMEWFKLFMEATELPKRARRVRAWDLAASRKTGAYTCGVLMCVDERGRYIVEDVVRGQWDPATRDDVIKSTAHADLASKGHVTIVIEREGGSSGKDQALAMTKLLVGFEVWSEHPTGPKEARAMNFASQLGGENVWFPKDAHWFSDFRSELLAFPRAALKDQVDATSAAFNKLVSTSGGAPVASGGGDGGGGGTWYDEQPQHPMTAGLHGMPTGGLYGMPTGAGPFGANGNGMER